MHNLAPSLPTGSLLFLWLVKRTVSEGKIYLYHAYFCCIFILKFVFNMYLDIKLTGWQCMKLIYFMFSEKDAVEASTISAAQNN